jgi:hypothetical protein
MIVRALDLSNDWTFGQSKANYLSYNPAIAQCIQTRVSSFLGNCFFDMGAGIDWFTFLGGSKNQLALELAISAVILNSYGVTGVLQLSASYDSRTRNINIAYDVTTIFTGTLSSSFVILTDEDGNILTDENGNSLLGG